MSKLKNILLQKLFLPFTVKINCYKGQLISRCLFSIFNSTLLLWYTASQTVLVCFLGELKTPKRHFEIN